MEPETGADTAETGIGDAGTGGRTDQPPTPWGFWATMGWTTLCVILYVGVFVALAFTFLIAAAVSEPRFDVDDFASELESDGFFLALGMFLGAACCIGFVVLLARMRGTPARNYLGLTTPRLGEVVKWVLFLALFIAVSDGATYLSGRPVVPPFMVDVYTTARFLPLLMLAVIVAAPLFEEILFRGFLFTGIMSSRLGAAPAVVITAFLWGMLHLGQYEFFYIGVIFLVGLLLGVARLKTGSTTLTILLHGIMNLVATIELVIQVEVLG